MRLIDTWANINNWRHHPIEVIYLSMGLLLLAMILPPMPGAALVLLTVTLCALFGARIPPFIFFRVLLLPLTFLLVGSLALVFSVSFDQSTGLEIAFSDQGMQTAKTVILRSISAVSALILLTLTVPLTEIITLMRRVRVPNALIELIELMYRFLFIFDEIFASLLKAQSVRLGYRNLWLSYRSLSSAVAVLFFRAMDRARRLESGLESRGYSGELRVLNVRRKISSRFFIFAVLVHFIILGITFISI